MGSPLAPVLANLFMGHHEKLWLENFQGSEILFYRRYVDDTFCLFQSEHDATTFFESAITSYKSKTIPLILTSSRILYIPLLLA